jgi:putative peptidoglycan lipid II flippase
MKAGTLFRTAGLISVLLIISRLLGYVREGLLAARFGATYATDAYMVAQDLPYSLFAAVSAALTMVFIPVYRDVVRKRGEEAGWRLVNTALNLTLLVSVALLLIGLGLAPLFVPRLAPGLPASAQALALSLTRIMLPMILFMGLGGVAAAVLNANQHFTAPALTGLMTNLPVVLTLAAIGMAGRIDWVAWSVVAGTAAGALILVPWLPGLGYRYRFTLDWRDPGLAQVGRLILPVLFTTTVINFQDFTDRFLASRLAEGTISALNYAVKVNSLPYGVVGAAIATVLYPSLAEHAAAGDLGAFRRTVGNGLRIMAFVLLPMALGLLAFRGPIVQIIFQRGAFDPKATVQTAFALGFYALGILFFGWQDYLNRCFFALQDTLTPMWAAAGLLVISTGLKVAMSGPLAHGGIALAMSLATSGSALWLLWRLRQRLGRLEGRELLRSVGISLVTASAGTAAGYFAYGQAARFFSGGSLVYQSLRLGVGLGIIVIVHVLLAIPLGNREGAEMAARLVRRLGRQKA